MSPDPSPASPDDAAKKAAERAKRMAAFSSKAIDEEDAPVAIRSFNQAREGADAGKVYSPKTGRVEDGTMSALPRKAGGGPSRIDDDDLLAEIDAAVDAAEAAQPKLPDLTDDADDDLLAEIDAAVRQSKEEGSAPTVAPPGMNARRLAAMAAAAGDKPEIPSAPPAGGGPRLPKGLAALAGAGDVDIKPPAGSFAGMSGAGLSGRKPGPSNLSEDDLAGLRPRNGVKPSSAVAGRLPAQDDGAGGEEPTVLSGRGRGGQVPRPGSSSSADEDDDLLAEIDAAVAAASQGEPQEGLPGALKSADGSSEDVADEGRKKEPATKYSGPAIHSPGDVGGFEAKVDKRTGAAAKATDPADDEFAVKSDKPKATPMAAGDDMAFAVKSDKGHGAAGADDLSPGKFEARLDREERKAPRILSPADAEKFEARLDKEARAAPKIRNPTEAENFEVEKDQSSGELAKNADAAVETPAAGVTFSRAQTHKGKDMPKMHNVGDHAPQARRDAEAKPLPRMRSAGDEGANVRRDAEPKALPKMRNAADEAVDAKVDREHREAPAFKGFNDAPVEARQDREHRAAPKIHSPGESRPDVKHDRETRDAPKFKGFNDAPVEARLDREHRAAPKILSPADGEKYAVNLDRAARDSPMPRMANPAEAGFETKRDAQSHAPPKLRNPTEAGTFETRRDAEAKPLPKLRNATDSASIHARQDHERKAPPRLANPTEAEAFEARRDAEAKPLPKLRNATDAEAIHARQDHERKVPPRLANPTEAEAFETRKDAEAKPLPKLRNATDSEAIHAKQDHQRKVPPRLANPTEAEAFETRKDAEAKPLPKLRNVTDAEPIEARRDAQAKPLPHMMSPADVDAYEARVAKESRGGIPSMRSPADAESYETKFAWRQKEVRGIRNAADDEATENKQDRLHREKANVSNPGQAEFDVKYEHESIWTTKPKRDRDDDTPAASKKKGS